MEHARELAVLLLVPLAVLAVIDGLWIHLWRLRLHARPECAREHRLHTARALLFPALLVLIYGRESTGGLLVLAALLAGVDTVLEAWDTFEEPRSRAHLGGLSRAEALLHVILVSLRGASLVLALAAKPAAAWSLTASAPTPPIPGWQAQLVFQGLLPGAVAVAALHVVLALRVPRVDAERFAS
jgi:hypothetical protein